MRLQTDPSVQSYAGPNESIADNDDAAAGQTVLPHLERIVRRIVHGFLEQLYKNIDAWISATMQVIKHTRMLVMFALPSTESLK